MELASIYTVHNKAAPCQASLVTDLIFSKSSLCFVLHQMCCALYPKWWKEVVEKRTEVLCKANNVCMSVLPSYTMV